MTADLWFPGAERLPGPARKTSGTSWPKEGAVYHSAELNLQGTLNVLQDVRPKANGSLPGSWHFTNAKDARSLIQHYALDVITWHARGGNTRNFGVENEGYAGEPLTEHQIAKLARLTAWAQDVCGWGELRRAGVGKNLWEHNEIGRQASPKYVTACPSGRIPWQRIMIMAEEDDMVTDEEREARAKAASVFATAEAYTAQGIDPPKDIVDRVLMYASVWKRRLE